MHIKQKNFIRLSLNMTELEAIKKIGQSIRLTRYVAFVAFLDEKIPSIRIYFVFCTRDRRALPRARGKKWTTLHWRP